MKKIVYIAGLGHSGSTILDMALGCHPNIVGLGEIYAVFTKKDQDALFEKSTCSCGKKGDECDFWKSLKEIAGLNKTTEQKYRELIRFFDGKYGKRMILLDSSKNSYPYLQFLNKEYDLYIIYLTRDYRSWVYSRFVRTRKLPVSLAIRWYLENRKLLFVLKKYGVKMLTVGYEELSLYPELILKKIAGFADLEYSEKMLYPDFTKSHIINGNISRVDTNKRQGFFYDLRWMTSGRISRLSFFSVIFNRLNRKLVYSNIAGSRQEDVFIFGNKRKEELERIHNES